MRAPKNHVQFDASTSTISGVEPFQEEDSNLKFPFIFIKKVVLSFNSNVSYIIGYNLVVCNPDTRKDIFLKL